MQVDIPYNYDPRDYQLPQFVARDNGCKRFVKVWHRRAGKDYTDIHFTVREALKRVGTYWHMLPKEKQARKAVWFGMNKDGRRFIDAFPGALNPSAENSIVKKINNNEMTIELKNGSRWQLVGSDNVDNLVGSNPVGLVMSEAALTNPKSWALLEPILEENGGWVILNSTPRGHNHFYEIYNKALSNENWFCQRVTVDDSKVISEDRIQELRDGGTPEEHIQSEYYCSFESAIVGAYYGEQIRWLEKEGRITDIDYNPAYEVHTWWDIGRSDYTSIWFVQYIGDRVYIIDFLESNGKEPSDYVMELKYKGYNYGSHNLPFDADHLRMGMSGFTIMEQFQNAYVGQNFVAHKRSQSEIADINVARSFVRRCLFDKTKTYQGLEALKNFHSRFNEKTKNYESTPFKDWTNHAADAFRYLAIGYNLFYNIDSTQYYGNLGHTFDQMLAKNKAGNY